ncbi:hypothetical protein [Maribacter arcticus]|uniref:hypothetical protein n=1 Tax=Maribacter arcticus TaxID=561365 RepID=UPI003001F533
MGIIYQVIDVATNQKGYSTKEESLELAGDFRIFKKTDRNKDVLEAEKVRDEAMKSVSSWAEYCSLMDLNNAVVDKNIYIYSTTGNKSPKKLKIEGAMKHLLGSLFIIAKNELLKIGNAILNIC